MKKLLALLLLVALPASAREPVRAPHAMVSCVSEIASRVGADVMKKGGNAVDAAVAVAFTLAVVWPEAGNLTGGGFMLVRTADGKINAVDYRERAPLAASRDLYLDKHGNVIPHASTVGYRAAGVPGTVAGLAFVQKKYGKLKWAQLVEPARKLASEGFVVSHFLATRMNDKEILDKLKLFDESVRVYMHNDGTPLREGETFKQPDLAATLARIQANPADFYKGALAKTIVADVKAHGGLITLKDLAAYHPIERKPLIGHYRGLDIVTFPPPSSGGVVLIESLNMLGAHDVKNEGAHLLLEVMRRAFADRAKWLGDPDFVKVPTSGIVNAKYAAARMCDYDPEHASSSAAVARTSDPRAYESPETTHFTIIDRDGNVVTNTFTLNDSFGSGATIKGTGMLLNDEMDDFSTKPGVPDTYGLLTSESNAIAPRKTPLSSMTPTIVMKDGKVWFALGSPGGPRIITAVMQVLLDIVDGGMNIQEAVDAPRLHHQWMPDEVNWEPDNLAPSLRAMLEAKGHKFRAKPESQGDVEVVMVDPKTGERLGAADSRRGGVAVGW